MKHQKSQIKNQKIKNNIQKKYLDQNQKKDNFELEFETKIKYPTITSSDDEDNQIDWSNQFEQMGNERNATYAKTQKIRKEKQFSSGDGSLRHDDFRDDSGSHIRRFDRRLNRSNG